MRWTGSVAKETLPNGLTVLVQRDSSVPVVAVVTHVKAGYFDEPDEWVGIAHVLEHMFFKGTTRRGPGELARQTQQLGGYLNAGTIYDKTVYYTVAPSANGGLAQAVELQADALMHLALDPDELSRELEVIIQEAKRKLDSPAPVTGETLYELLFKVHRMRRWRIGTEIGLRALSAENLRSYYTSRYTPGKVIVALAGDIEVDRALDIAREAYGDWSLTDTDVPGSPGEPPAQRAILQILRGDVERPIASAGWRTVGPLHADTPALDVASVILGSGRASWLAQAVRKPGLASAAGSSNYTPNDVGVFDLSLTSDLDHIGGALARSLGLVATLAEQGPDRGQLERVRALTATRWARHFESVDGRATTLAEFEALGSVELADRYFDQLMAVTPEAVRRVAHEHLRPDAVCAAVYLPERTAVAGLDETDWPPQYDRVQVPGLDGARMGSPTGFTALEGKAEEVGDGVLLIPAEGADLLVKSKHGSGLASLAVYFPGTRLEETRETAGVSWLLARSSLRGAGGLDAEELAASAERLGGGIGAVAGSETTGWRITVPAEHAGEAMSLLHLVASAPTLDRGELEIERALQANDAAREHDDMYGYPLQRALAQAFPGDPYGLPALGDPAQVGTLDLERVFEWARRIASSRPIVVAVGDLDRDVLRRAVEPFAGWSRVGETTGYAAHPVWSSGRGMETREKAQSALAMAFRAPGAASQERYAMTIISAVLSGLAGRLFDELRERRALAYTVNASPWLRRRSGAMLAYIATSPDREGEARDAMLAELDRLVREPVSELELDRARNYAAGLVAIRRQRAQSVGSEISAAWLYGTLSEIGDDESRLRSVKAEEVLATAAAVFVPDQRAEYVVRGTGKSR